MAALLGGFFLNFLTRSGMAFSPFGLSIATKSKKRSNFTDFFEAVS
jgi:hypothetical protein